MRFPERFLLPLVRAAADGDAPAVRLHADRLAAFLEDDGNPVFARRLREAAGCEKGVST